MRIDLLFFIFTTHCQLNFYRLIDFVF